MLLLYCYVYVVAACMIVFWFMYFMFVGMLMGVYAVGFVCSGLSSWVVCVLILWLPV